MAISSRTRIALILATVYNGCLFAVASANLQANNFVVKFLGQGQGFSFVHDGLYRWLCYAPLLIPLWLYLFNRALKVPVRALRVGAALTAAASCLAAVPFMGVQLAVHVPVEWHLKRMLIDGLTQPSAFLFTALGMILLLRSNPSPAPANRPSLRLVLVAVGGLALLRLTSGPAVPLLEDELAYHVQALIFESGQLVGRAPQESADLLALPFVVFEQGRFYSAHMHGWSWVLAMAGLLGTGLKGVLNAFLTVANLALLAALCWRFFSPREQAVRGITLTLFALCPAVFLLSHSVMAHTLALTCGLSIFYSWLSMRLPRSSPASGRILGWAALLLVSTIAAILIRPQGLAPILGALVVYEVLELLLIRGKPAAARAGFLRLALLLTAAGAAVGVLWAYARWFESPDLMFMTTYMGKYLTAGCQTLGFGPGHGCFPNYGTMGHSFRKFLLNAGDIFVLYNGELAPGNLPVGVAVVVLAVRNYRSLLPNPERPLLAVLGVVAANALLFSLYFHNGGESYRGRYLSDTAFAFYLLLGGLLAAELARPGHAEVREQLQSLLSQRGVLAMMVFAVACLALLQVRGGYVNVFLEKQPAWRTPDGKLLRQALVLVHSRDSFGGIDAKTGQATVPDEFQRGRLVRIERQRVHRYLNLGYPMAVGRSVRLGPHGFPEDRYGNIMVRAEALTTQVQREQLLRRTGRKSSIALHFPTPRPGLKRLGMRRWIRTPYVLLPPDAPGPGGPTP